MNRINKLKLKFSAIINLIFISNLTFKFSFIILSISLFFSKPAFSFDEFLNSSRYNSMVGAGIASTSRLGMEDFGLINPAILSTNADLVLAGGYADGKSQNQDISGYSVSILDSTSGAWNSEKSEILQTTGFPLASILYYTNFDFGSFEDQYFQLGVSQPLSSRISFGLSGNYSILKSSTVNENIFDLGAGFLWHAFEQWTFGLSAMHLLDRRDEFVPGYLRRALGAGIEYAPSQSVKIRGDFWRARDASDQTQSVIKVGVTNSITENFLLQFGFADDKTIDSKVIGMGFILAGPKLSLSYALKRETSYSGLLHSVDIRLPVW